MKRDASRTHHLRQMVALMGPPPPALLERSRDPHRFLAELFEENGQWTSKLPMVEMSLESEESKLEGQDKVEFLHFMRRILQWDPDMRPTAEELCEDPWLKFE